uniref:Uncharacterized protein n=1 Tax=Chromera velia CCMP2878 TaxID=1169474 RepID=A0A0G4I0H9_9ALVE|eukprot:Cvel_34337.t1-p1 / transcript=Cvel_34337.t1 / gene=Cvel_34337 / organism=Chromera_velia_CCMP2878 / gene_product=hypothetical protein / transcript_product=hypothetical protein / location=Cvel_scaffold5860:3044-3286(+) / protein_length=81 / sequence_SO=supercontig / SO=protein_coding / is_pseudo=false
MDGLTNQGHEIVTVRPKRSMYFRPKLLKEREERGEKFDPVLCGNEFRIRYGFCYLLQFDGLPGKGISTDGEYPPDLRLGMG